jgi:tetratricopeptide (TPR) repeat protein
MAKKRIIDAVSGTDPKTRRWKTTLAAARMAYEAGEFQQARNLLARARELTVDMPESAFALHATDVASAAVLIASGRAPEAGKQLEKTISSLQASGDRMDRELLAVAFRFYAQAQADAGNVRGAEKELQKSIEILDALGTEASVQLAYSLSDLCGLYLTLGRHSEAEVLIVKAMKIASVVLGPESPEYVRADMIYQACAPMTDEAHADVASDGIRKMQYAFGGNHPNISRALDRYFKALNERGDAAKLEEARQKFGAKHALAK